MTTRDKSFRLLFAASPLPMWLYDRGTLAFLEVNDATVARYGYAREEFLRMRVTDIRTAEEAERLEDELSRPPSTFEYSAERRHRLRDGRLIDVEVVTRTLEFRGRPAALVAVHDITDRKRALRALQQSEVRKAAILESALDCIITLDGDGRVVEFNPAAERTFGYRQDEAIGTPLADLIVPSDLRQAHRDGLLRHRATGQHNLLGRRIEMRAIRADGVEFPVELAITVIEGNGETFYTGYLRDISEQKAAEEGLRRLNAELDERVRQRTAQLQAAVEELEAFSYSVSHDLRAPLRSIDGFSLALVEDAGPDLPPGAQRHVERIRGATQRMAHLIDDLLTLSKASRGEMIREQVNLSDLAARIAAERRHHDPDRAVTLTIEPDMVAPGDARLVRVVLENLLDNAWKFTSRRRDARIEVGRTIREGDAVAYYVRDNGAGFDPAFAGKLFAPFQRLHAAAEFPGTGIGLATVRRIVHRHGGRVWAEGRVGQGACVSFTLG